MLAIQRVIFKTKAKNPSQRLTIAFIILFIMRQKVKIKGCQIMDHSFLLYLNKILLLSLTMKRIERKTFMLKDFVSLVKSANNPRKKNCSGCAMGSTRICILFWTSVLKNKYSLFLHVAISAMNLVIRFYSRRKTL